jgi:integrase/recombinase XerD
MSSIPDEIQDSIELFLEGFESEHTVRAYRRHLESAFRTVTLSPPSGLTAITSERLGRYRAELLEDGRSPQTHAQALSALRKFLSWARLHLDYAVSAEAVKDALRLPRTKVDTPFSIVTRKEGGDLFRALESPRNEAILAVFLGSGLRVSELSALRLSDIRDDGEGGAVLRVQGKGGKGRLVPLAASVLDAIDRYLASSERRRGKGQRGPLFLPEDRGAKTRTTAAITPRGVRMVIRDAAKAAGIVGKSVSPHALRHSFAVWGLRQGANIEQIRRLLGHSSIETTKRYLDHLELGELRRALPDLP